MELKDENGDPFFVTHTFVMACAKCQENGTPAASTQPIRDAAIVVTPRALGRVDFFLVCGL